MKIVTKKHILWILFCVSCLNLNASCLRCPEPSSEFIFGLYGNTQSYKYIEPNVMDIGGTLNGIGINASYSNQEVIQLFTGEYLSGNLAYNGAECNMITGLCTPIKANSKDWYAFGEYYVKPIIGKDVDFTSTLDIGVGYRFLQNKIDSTYAYTRKQSYLYLLFGGSIEYKLSNFFKVYGSAHYRYLIRGFNTSYMKELGYDNNLNFTQKEGQGVKFLLGLKLDLESYNLNNYLFVAIYFDWWTLDGSDIKTLYAQSGGIATFYEPKNNTQAIGLMIGTGF